MNAHRYPRQNALSWNIAHVVLAALLLFALAWSSPALAATAPPPRLLFAPRLPSRALSSSITQVSAGFAHTCALRSDSSIACWGDNEFGQSTPPDSNSGFIQVSAGLHHTCALKSDNSVSCWGGRFPGPVTPPTPNSDFAQVSAGGGHTCAVKNDGSIACWGSNYSGRASPPSPNSGFTQVSAGINHTCAVKSDGSIACWGENLSGEASPPTPNSDFTHVSTGWEHTCALKGNGSIECWGEKDYGQASPPSPNSGFIQVSAGDYHTCALRSDGSIDCWGDNFFGQASPPIPNSGFTQVSAGGAHNCALKGDGVLACWGDNYWRQAPLIDLSPALTASIAYGDSYGQAFTATGGPGGEPYSFEVIAGSLPPGLSLASDGTLSGTPTQAGSYTFTLRMQDAIRYTSTQDYSLDVSRAPLTVRADDLTRDFGTPNPPLSYAFSGFKDGDGPGVVSGTPPLLETDAGRLSPIGTYEIRITPGSLAAENYEISYASGWLHILGFPLYLPAVLR